MTTGSIYLNWKDIIPNSGDWYTYNLFSYLSRRWYPVNIVGSTVYDIFSGYGEQLSSASAEISQVFDDLGIETTRSGPLFPNSNFSKLYDNFGSFIGYSRLYGQDINYYNEELNLQSYRQQLRYLFDAYLSGGSIKGLERIIQSFFGISPLIFEPVKDYEGWTLTTYTGSIVSKGDTFVIFNPELNRLGKMFPTTGSFNPGDKVAISWSKLGINTKIFSKKQFYSGIDAIIYGPTSLIYATSSVLNPAIEKTINKVLRADLFIHTSGSTAFNTYRPSLTGVGVFCSPELSLSDAGYIYNNIGTSSTGSVYIGKPLGLTSAISSSSEYGYGIYGSARYSKMVFSSDYDWYYDWIVFTKNDASYTFSIREYPTYIIPDTVYFKDYNKEPISFLPFDSGSLGGHWIFNDLNKLYDISGNKCNLILVASTSSLPTYTLSRRDFQPCIYTTGFTAYTGSIGIPLNFTNSFYFEMWIKGIDSSGSLNASSIIFKHQNSVDYSDTLFNPGYMFGIDINNKFLTFKVYSTSYNIVTGSISTFLQEIPSRYHYFAGTYISGSVYLYADDRLLCESHIGSLPTLNSNAFTAFIIKGKNIGIDELVVSNGFLDYETAKEHFNLTKPRITRLGIPPSSLQLFHQPKITIYASKPNEVEFHQFSIRQLLPRNNYVFNKSCSELFKVPIFKYSGSI